jgi:5-methylthioadenosine/S-adenosylhomocysteine deaminase
VTNLVDCDLLVTGGIVVCNAAPDSILADGAIAVAGDEIVAIGPTHDLVARFRPARSIDAQGGIVMPGFVNTHNHSPLKIVRGVAPDLGFAPAYIKGIPQGDKLDDDDARALARLGTLELLLNGSTTIVDHYQHADACASAAAEIGARAYVGGRIADVDVAALAQGEWRRDAAFGAAMLRRSEDLFSRWDGHDGGRIRCVVAAHAPDTCSPEILRDVRELAAARNVGVHIHLAQSTLEIDRVRERTGRHSVELLEELGLLNDRLVAAHCIRVDEAQIGRIGAAAACVSHAPIGNAQGGMMAPIRALQQAGATISLCTDSKSGDMFEVARMALLVARMLGSGFDLKAVDTFAWATQGGAAALGRGDDLGVLAPGYKADFLVLDPADTGLRPVVDPIGLLVHVGAGRQIVHVVVAGRIVVEDRLPTLVDRDDVIADAARVAEKLWAGSASTGWRRSA